MVKYRCAIELKYMTGAPESYWQASAIPLPVVQICSSDSGSSSFSIFLLQLFSELTVTDAISSKSDRSPANEVEPQPAKITDWRSYLFNLKRKRRCKTHTCICEPRIDLSVYYASFELGMQMGETPRFNATFRCVNTKPMSFPYRPETKLGWTRMPDTR